METDLFTPAGGHDAGGKMKTALHSGVKGDAFFTGERDQYRPLLQRWVGDKFPDRYIVFIGMNPSTASADFNDPTITREWTFAVREGYGGLQKINVGDYRATDPKDLMKPSVIACSKDNLLYSIPVLEKAEKIVLCHGILPKPLREAGARLHRILSTAGPRVFTFGLTAGGSPRHPLYLRGDAPLIPWSYTNDRQR